MESLLAGQVLGPLGDPRAARLVIKDGLIANVDFDWQGQVDDEKVLLPGFIDLQINGGWGFDFATNPAAMWEVAEHLPGLGVTAFLVTLISCPDQIIQHALDCLEQGPPGGDEFRGAKILGLHLEGPYLAAKKRGAHREEYLAYPNASALPFWLDSRHIKMVTIAPELPEALALIEALAQREILVSLGHSEASLEESQQAVAGGARAVTHLFNAMPPLHHRRPGLVAEALNNDELSVGIIVDGIHVAPAMVQLAWKLKQGRNFYLVSDAMAALGMPEGRHQLGDLAVEVDDSSVWLATDDGPERVLAGSKIGLDEAFRKLLAFCDCNLEEASRAASQEPARLLGLAAELGSLKAGAAADFVVLDESQRVKACYVSGELVYSAPD